MIKASLERFDSPTVIINQVHHGEDWSVVATYVSKQDIVEAEGETGFADIGWHVSITLPNLDDVDFDQTFSTPEAALEFGIKQIVSGNLKPAKSPATSLTGDKSHPFGHYDSIV